MKIKKSVGCYEAKHKYTVHLKTVVLFVLTV